MNLKEKIELHGRSFKKDAVFALIRMVIVLGVMVYFFKEEIDTTVILFLILYVTLTVLFTYKKYRKEMIYFNFKSGNPVYDMLAQYGDPNAIVAEIDREIEKGYTIYDKREKPKKTNPETVITESYFVHLNKKAIIFPLSEIVCAYMYDSALRATPAKKFLPTYFKPIHLIITYGKGREAIIIYSAIEYEKVLDILDNKLNCKIAYNRDLGLLYNSDYDTFLVKVKEVIDAK